LRDATSYNNTSFTQTILGLGAAISSTSGTRTDFTRTPDGQLISMRVGPTSGYNPTTTTNSYYSMLDDQKSVLGLTDSTGHTVAQYAYDPYGVLKASTGTIAANNPFRYTSSYYDNSTGLYHLGARYYSPAGGRFTQQDPKSHVGDLAQNNEFTYAGDAPVNVTDLNGLDWLDFATSLSGALFKTFDEILAGSALGEAFAPALDFGITLVFGAAAPEALVATAAFAIGYGIVLGFENFA
jgi:RHS repeat-associated protein